MKKWLSHLTIFCYLGALSWGIVAHTFEFMPNAHPAMYFVVWDMFCGWSSYEIRTQIIAEGESGAFYEVAPGPWGDFYPYGDTGRRHYDQIGTGMYRMAKNTLDHTQHEPITRIIFYEEVWPKKYNLPDSLWRKRFDEPKDPQIYRHLRSVFSPEGDQLANYNSWLMKEYHFCVADNPRLIADTRKASTFYAVDPRFRDINSVSQDTFSADHFMPVGSPLGH